MEPLMNNDTLSKTFGQIGLVFFNLIFQKANYTNQDLLF